MIKYDHEIFEDNSDASMTMIWHLLNLLGGKIVVPLDEQFWNSAIPKDASLVLYKQDGEMILEAERLDNSQ
jgi:hypothetical protein